MRTRFPIVVRTLILLVAVAICAWFALGIRQAHDTARATAIVSQGGRLTAEQASSATSLLHAAGFLNPDNGVDILRGEVASESGNLRQARKLLLAAVHEEPQNPQAWVALAIYSRSLPLYTEAGHVLARLVPRVPSSR